MSRDHRFQTFECERCRREVRTRLPHPTRTRERERGGVSPEMWCLKCTDAERRANGGPPPSPSPAKIKKDDAARNPKLWGGAFNEAK